MRDVGWRLWILVFVWLAKVVTLVGVVDFGFGLDGKSARRWLELWFWFLLVGKSALCFFLWLVACKLCGVAFFGGARQISKQGARPLPYPPSHTYMTSRSQI